MPSRDITLCDQRLQDVFAKANVIWLQRHPSLLPKPSCTQRSEKEQEDYYAQGRTTPGKIVTNAQWPNDPHCCTPAQAFDLFFTNTETNKAEWDTSLYIEYNDIIQSIDSTIVYGGNFRSLKGGDHDHWETPDWKNFIPIS